MQSIRDSEVELVTATSAMKILTASGGFLTALFAAQFLYGMLVWAPVVNATTHFSFEVSRFVSRIQGLASQSELAELALAEVRVVDEAALRRFILVAADIARKHSAIELAARLDLWGVIEAKPVGTAEWGAG